MLTVVTFKWKSPDYRPKFTSEHVLTLRRMVARHYPDPHRFVCITDDADGLGGDVEVVPLWDDLADVQNPTGGGRPTCYRRLKLFAPDIAETLGERIVWLDLDTVITGDLRPLWNRPEDVVLWENPQHFWPYNGAMGLLTAGARPQVWQDFEPEVSPAQTHAMGYRGSDQAWLSHKIPGEAVWTEDDGVYYANSLRGGHLPDNARIVFFTGRAPPWTSRMRWVSEHYR